MNLTFVLFLQVFLQGFCLVLQMKHVLSLAETEFLILGIYLAAIPFYVLVPFFNKDR